MWIHELEMHMKSHTVYSLEHYICKIKNQYPGLQKLDSPKFIWKLSFKSCSTTSTFNDTVETAPRKQGHT